MRSTSFCWTASWTRRGRRLKLGPAANVWRCHRKDRAIYLCDESSICCSVSENLMTIKLDLNRTIWWYLDSSVVPANSISHVFSGAMMMRVRTTPISILNAPGLEWRRRQLLTKKVWDEGFNCLPVYRSVLCRQVYHLGVSTLDVVLIRS